MRKAVYYLIFIVTALGGFAAGSEAQFSNGQNASLVLGQSNFTSRNGATTQSGIFFPRGVSLDSSGNVWVADTRDSRVLEFKPPFSNGMNASLVLGQSNFTSSTTATTQSGMYYPDGVSVDSSGNVWVVDSYNNRVLEFVPPFSNGMNASLVLGQSNFTSITSAVTQSGMYIPQGVAVDSSGNVWVADSNSRVLEFKPPFSNGMNASLVLGKPNFTYGGDYNYGATQSGMDAPPGVAVDSSGNVWVVDSYSNRVLEFKPPFSNGMNASLVLGQSNFTSGNMSGNYTPNLTQSGMYIPQGVAVDSSGNVWVADSNNSRVLEFVPPFSNGMNASLVLGQSNFTSNVATTTQLGMSYPDGVSVDSSGNVWVADTSNSRILGFTLPPLLTEISLGISSISWSWNSIPGATSYDFYPSTGGAPINLSGTTFTQTNLSTNTSYGAQVSELTSSFEGSPSASVFVYTLAAPPTGFAFTQVNVSSVTVVWSANGNPTSTTSYRVEYWQLGGSTTSLTTTATQETITGLFIGATYYLSVSAINGNGIAAPSEMLLSTVTFVPSGVSTATIGLSGGEIVYQGVYGPNDIQITPNAYSQNVQVTLQTPDQSSLACNASPAENLTPTDIALEVDLNPAIEPVSPVTISLSYANASIGSMNPEQFLIARCDPTNNTWTPLPSTVDSSAKSVTATSDHLSVFQIMSGTPPTSVSQYKVGPNPLRPALGESQMKFVVPPNSDIKIYTLTGELVNDITAAPDGTASWNATNRSGRAVASGVYFVLIRGNGQSKTIKVIVER